MNLADLRRVTVKKHLRIRFALSNGMECLVTEQGIARVPALHAVPTFNLEEELAVAEQFVVEPTVSADKPRNYTRAEMSALISAGAAGEGRHEEHEE